MLLVLAAPAVSAPTEWVVAGSGADMTVTLVAQKTIPPALSPGVPRLVLLCRKQEANLAIVVDKGRSPTHLRFDGETATLARTYQQEKFSWFSDRRQVVDAHIFYFEKTGEILSSLLSHQSLLVSSMAYAQPDQFSTFRLAGLEPHLAAFEQACGLEKPLPRPELASRAGGSKKESPTPPPAAAPPATTFGGWKVDRSVSPLDDKQVVLLSLLPQPTRVAPGLGRTALVLRCRRGETEAFLDFYRALLSPNYLPVQASVDGGQPKQWWLVPSGNNTNAYFFASGPQLLKRLLASREFRVSIGPKKRKKGDDWMPEGELLYSLDGLERASRVLLEGCPVDLAQLKVKDGLGPLP